MVEVVRVAAAAVAAAAAELDDQIHDIDLVQSGDRRVDVCKADLVDVVKEVQELEVEAHVAREELEESR